MYFCEHRLRQVLVIFHRLLCFDFADTTVPEAFLHRILVTPFAVLWRRHSQSRKEEIVIGFPYTFIP